MWVSARLCASCDSWTRWKNGYTVIIIIINIIKILENTENSSKCLYTYDILYTTLFGRRRRLFVVFIDESTNAWS